MGSRPIIWKLLGCLTLVNVRKINRSQVNLRMALRFLKTPARYVDNPGTHFEPVHFGMPLICAAFPLKSFIDSFRIRVGYPGPRRGLLDREPLIVDQAAQLLSLLVGQEDISLYHDAAML